MHSFGRHGQPIISMHTMLSKETKGGKLGKLCKANRQYWCFNSKLSRYLKKVGHVLLRPGENLRALPYQLPKALLLQ